MTLIVDRYDDLSALALQAARAVKKRYPMVDTDDLQQTALMWCVSHPRKLREYLDDDDEKRGLRMLVASMKNAARDYGRRQRAMDGGYELEDEAFYSRRMLKGDGNSHGLLHFVFDRASWTKPPVRTDAPVRGADPAEGNTWLATMVDIDRALASLNDAEYLLLKGHYRDGLTYDQLGAKFKPAPVSKATVASYVDKAVAKVQNALGGPKPRQDPAEDEWEPEPEYVGTRRAISNAHARAITDNQEHAPQGVPARV